MKGLPFKYILHLNKTVITEVKETPSTVLLPLMSYDYRSDTRHASITQEDDPEGEGERERETEAPGTTGKKESREMERETDRDSVRGSRSMDRLRNTKCT